MILSITCMMKCMCRMYVEESIEFKEQSNIKLYESDYLLVSFKTL